MNICPNCRINLRLKRILEDREKAINKINRRSYGNEQNKEKNQI